MNELTLPIHLTQEELGFYLFSFKNKEVAIAKARKVFLDELYYAMKYQKGQESK